MIEIQFQKLNSFIKMIDFMFLISSAKNKRTSLYIFFWAKGSIFKKNDQSSTWNWEKFGPLL